MKTILALGLIISLIISMCIGIVRYKRVDDAMRLIVIYVAIQLGSEIVLYITAKLDEYDLRAVIINIYSIIEICLITAFFIRVLKPDRYKKLLIIFWPLIAILNMLFLQPFDGLNSNFLLIQSFGVITMSLYFIYWLLKKDIVRNIFGYPHFRIATLWLLMWSATLFFWATIKMLYNNNWKYTDTLMYIHATISIIVYLGIGATLFFYPKNKTLENL